MRNHRQIAMHLEHTDLPVTYLAANVYMEDLLSAADTVREQGAVLAPAGDGASAGCSRCAPRSWAARATCRRSAISPGAASPRPWRGGAREPQTD